MFLLLFLLYVILTCSGLVLIKLGGSESQIALMNHGITMNFNFKLILGLLCYVVSFLLFTYILQKRDLSYIYPISAGVVNVVSVLAGVLLLKEKLSLTGVVGTAVVILGIIIINIRG